MRLVGAPPRATRPGRGPSDPIGFRGREGAMATYLMLAKWTEQGVKNVKETVNRSEQVVVEFERRGVKTHGIYWLQGGQIDAIMIAESPDEHAVAAATLAVKSYGNIRIETHRAFTAPEMQAIIERM